MAVEIVFNELSLKAPFDNKQVARNKMSEFIDTLRTATTQGAERKLCTQSNFDSLELASGYQIIQWRNDLGVEREERSFLRSLQSKNEVPLPDDCPIDPEVETSYLGTHPVGLEYAYLFEALAVSFHSEDQWNCDLLQLTTIKLEKSGDLVDDLVDVFHASYNHHVVKHSVWITSQRRINILNGIDLWDRRNELLPNLKLCASIAEQISTLKAGSLMLRPTIRRLFEFEDYCRNWQTGAFSPEALPCLATTESQVTLQKYGVERTFLCPDGQKRLFSWHVRLTPQAWRMYFIPEEPNSPGQTGSMIVGYVGPHLRTAHFG